MPNLVTEIRILGLASVPLSLDTVDVKESCIGSLVKPNVVENEKLRLGTEASGVCNSSALEISRRLTRDETWIAAVILMCDRINNVATIFIVGSFKNGSTKQVSG